mmetsp:Transcript_64530/g.185538  ORF Transcript_64530/g.185538 Transcript_64530/m.185538 type:complete len:339 (-) Transcript_64530:252-1268(-)
MTAPQVWPAAASEPLTLRPEAHLPLSSWMMPPSKLQPSPSSCCCCRHRCRCCPSSAASYRHPSASCRPSCRGGRCLKRSPFAAGHRRASCRRRGRVGGPRRDPAPGGDRRGGRGPGCGSRPGAAGRRCGLGGAGPRCDLFVDGRRRDHDHGGGPHPCASGRLDRADDCRADRLRGGGRRPGRASDHLGACHRRRPPWRPCRRPYPCPCPCPFPWPFPFPYPFWSFPPSPLWPSLCPCPSLSLSPSPCLSCPTSSWYLPSCPPSSASRLASRYRLSWPSSPSPPWRPTLSQTAWLLPSAPPSQRQPPHPQRPASLPDLRLVSCFLQLWPALLGDGCRPR